MKKVLSTVIAFAMLFALVGCGGGQTAAEPMPEDTVKAGIETLKSVDTESAAAVWGDSLSAESMGQGEEGLKALYSGIEYEIIGAEINEDTAIVTTKISNVDAATALTDALGEVFVKIFEVVGTDEEITDEDSRKMFTELFVANLTSGEYDRTESTVDITLTKVDGEWVIDDNNDAAIDALTGGILTAAESLEGFS